MIRCISKRGFKSIVINDELPTRTCKAGSSGHFDIIYMAVDFMTTQLVLLL